MIQRQLKLRLNRQQEEALETWLWRLTGVWNWALRKVELDARDRRYYSEFEFINLLADHSRTLEIPSHTLQGLLRTVYQSWMRHITHLAKKPKFKGRRNALTSIPFPDPFRAPKDRRFGVPGLGRLKYHKQELPVGRIKCGRLIRRPSGWYLCLAIDAEPQRIPHRSDGLVGIDPGFHSLLTLSTGEKIVHPREWERTEQRLGQAQRGRRKQLTARLHERVANRRKDRNHKLSRRLVEGFSLIAFSTDRVRGLAKVFGKSVASSGQTQLRHMLDYKCRTGGRQYVEVDSRHSTSTCSACRFRTGPSGFAGLSVRRWTCSVCGAEHDRDINAAVNTLNAGLGSSHEGGLCRVA